MDINLDTRFLADDLVWENVREVPGGWMAMPVETVFSNMPPQSIFSEEVIRQGMFDLDPVARDNAQRLLDRFHDASDSVDVLPNAFETLVVELKKSDSVFDRGVMDVVYEMYAAAIGETDPEAAAWEGFRAIGNLLVQVGLVAEAARQVYIEKRNG